MKHSEGSFVGKKRVKIYRQSWQPVDKPPKAVVVMVHGLGEHSGRYRHVAEQLVSVGCAVHALDHRGHGKSGGARAFVDRYVHAVDDIEQLAALARQEHPGKPVFMLGHSMGGAFSLSYSLKYGDKLKGLILSGPAVALDGAPWFIKPIARFLSAMLPKLGLFGIDPSVVTRDPEMAAGYASDPLNCHGKVPARTLGEIIRMVEWLPLALPLLKMPVLVLHGGADKLAGVAGSQMIVKRAGSTDKTLKVYDELYHEIFNELPADRERVFADLREWIKAHIAA